MADNTTTYTNIQGYPTDTIKNYSEQAMGRAAELAGRNYESYADYAKAHNLSGDQVQQFTGLQNRAFAGAGDLDDEQGKTYQDPYSVAAAQGLQSLAGSSFGQQQADQYMSPYMQSVVDIQKREAQRQSGIQGTQQQAQAAQAGAFGGGRDAIMRAERERNLGQQMGDIQSMGSQAAFQQAQQQYNADQNRAGQSYATLGSQGQNLYGQKTGNLNLANLFGTQQQQQGQNMLDVSQQNYAAEQNYPYKQLGFMSDIVNRQPIGNLGQTITQPPPSLISQLAGAGTTAYGMYQMGKKAAGGSIHEQRGAGLNDLAMYQMSRG
jgi:hypothetical protein